MPTPLAAALICRYGHVGATTSAPSAFAANESYFEVTSARTRLPLKALRRAVIAPDDEGLVIEQAPPRARPRPLCMRRRRRWPTRAKTEMAVKRERRKRNISAVIGVTNQSGLTDSSVAAASVGDRLTSNKARGVCLFSGVWMDFWPSA
jgi:hypothetical protein